MTDWQQAITDLKSKYPELHYHYSSLEGWAVISWKGKSVTIFDFHNKQEIESLISKLK